MDRSRSPSGSTTKRIATPQNFSHLIAKSVRKPVSKALTNLAATRSRMRLPGSESTDLCRRHARSNNKSGRFDRLFAAMHESAIGRYCRKKILRGSSSNIDSRRAANAQDQFKNPACAILLLRVVRVSPTFSTASAPRRHAARSS